MNKLTPTYEFLHEEKTKELLKVFKGERTGWVLVGSKKYCFPSNYVEQGEGFYNFKARSTDTWVASYPRSGTTLTQELVWLLCNNLDYDTAKTKYLTRRFPFLEFSLFNHPEITKELIELNKDDLTKQQLCKSIAKPGYKVLEEMSSPRFIKTHFPFSLLPNILECGCKIVYVARNPKDVCVSWYNLCKDIKTMGYIGTFEQFWNYFQNDITPWNPYWIHLKEAWAVKEHPNVLFIFYEEMQENFLQTVKKVATFLGKEYSDDQLNELATYLDIKNFRNNSMVNLSDLKECQIMEKETFVRQGRSGGWKDFFTPNLEIEANQWIIENLKNTDMRFPNFNNNLDFNLTK
ncbi:hypothetical protein HZH68_002078 [Vespula germanica]|uniref:Sulfotransferase domain-containing protein n=1 Tax=Vespula germanica TaxID=30212 RepID=A0A834KT67_VESGE|nr:hypothetical protein HZH68_002078 [Vespula germanica]